MNTRKSITASTSLTEHQNELLDELAHLQGVSNSEIIRRAIELLALQCGLEKPRYQAQHHAAGIYRRCD